MKYIIDFAKSFDKAQQFNASKKAPADIQRTMKSMGAKCEYIVLPDSKCRPAIWYAKFRSLLRLFRVFKPGDELYFQGYGYERATAMLVHWARKKNIKCCYLIHDVNFLRYEECMSDTKEVNFLKGFDCLYVHTEAMAERLQAHGIHTEMKVMHLFDYYSDNPMMSREERMSMKNVVAFAGNLDKSLFLPAMKQMPMTHGISFRLYGLAQDTSILENEHITYMGAFKPSETGTLKAGWGLLWDGDSIDTCSGELGCYLKVNASHKLSLYLACGMPVIIWKESSLAKWLTQQGVCITINSLREIPEALSNITEQQYSMLIDNSIKLGNKLRQGGLLKSLLQSSEYTVGGGNLRLIICMPTSIMSNPINTLAA